MKSLFGLIRIMSYLSVLICILVSSAFAEDFYIAQNSAGGDIGANCSNAHSSAWFNTSGNWGAGAGKISGGDTVHLCGTFSNTNNAPPMLTFQGGGSSGSPVTLIFETGAKLEAYYWGSSGAINLNGNNYLVLDGGATCGYINGVKTTCNGIIRNTKAGASSETCPDGNPCTYPFANDTGSALIRTTDGANATGIEIKNLQLGPLYLRPLATTVYQGMSTSAIMIYPTIPNEIRVHHNIFEGAGKMLMIGNGYNAPSGTVSGYYVYNNDFSNMCWGMTIAYGPNTGTFVKNIQIHDNKFSDWRWARNNFSSGVGDPCHTNGTMLFIGWGDYRPSYIGDNTSNIYNNYFYGSLRGGYQGSSPSGYLSGQDNFGPVNIFNNLVVDTEPGGSGGGGIYSQSSGSGGQKVYNNTVIREGGACINLRNDRESQFGKPVVKNNICVSGSFIETYDAVPNGFITDYNDGYGTTSAWVVYNIGAGYNPVSLSTWKSTYGQEAHGITSNPNLDGNYKPQASSPIVAAGVNLTSMGITALNYDRAGVARPSSGAWSIGAYQYNSSTPLLKIPFYPGTLNISP